MTAWLEDIARDPVVASAWAVEAAGEEDVEDVGEIEIADYLVFLFALDTYMRYIEESSGIIPENEAVLDIVLHRGIALLRVADKTAFRALEGLFREHLKNQSALKMLDAVMRTMPTARGAAVRALRLRTILCRASTSVAKAIFGKSTRARSEVLAAVEASTLEDSDAALTKFAAITLRNKIVEKWIDKAAEASVPLNKIAINPIQEASQKTSEQTAELHKSIVTRAGVEAASEESAVETAKQGEVLRGIEEDARESAQKAMQTSGEEDRPLTKSEVVGVATAVAAAQAADPENLRNLPPSFINDGLPLDPEQQAAALTDGLVLVAAGAGSGKCVRGDTLVRTSKGLIPIAEFAADLEYDQSKSLTETVLGMNGLEKTSTIYHNGYRPTIRLNTRLGYCLEGTSNHPILVLRGTQVEWVKLGEIELSDHVCIDRRPGFFPDELFQVEHKPFVKRTNSMPSSIPGKLTPQVAALLGYIVSEGQVDGHYSAITLTTTDEAQLPLYKQSAEGIVDKFSIAEHHSPRGNKILTLRFHRKADLEALIDFGLTYTLAHDKEVPAGVLRSPKEVIVAFLRALFDGDGWFYSNTIGYASASEKLSRQVPLGLCLV
jgi:hypothetical protein